MICTCVSDAENVAKMSLKQIANIRFVFDVLCGYGKNKLMHVNMLGDIRWYFVRYLNNKCMNEEFSIVVNSNRC